MDTSEIGVSDYTMDLNDNDDVEEFKEKVFKVVVKK